ncbi:MAG TPA: GntR family transcriptional regulator [Solirubrobacteraceae bacterium]|nr:GntR family transcriptional regulator [Solirubrobacteraceae bacterium]
MTGEVLPLTPLRRLGHEPARTLAYAALREAIVAMDLPPGVRLSENELAARLGVSRTPIREALIRLRDEQLVEIAPQRGTFVAPISVVGVRDAQFVREALECAAVRLAAERAGDDDIAGLRVMIEAQHQARDAGDLEGFYLLDEAFHTRLSDLSGHAIASSLAQRAKGHLDRVRRLSLPLPNYLDTMIAEHEGVVAAVAAHDPDTAEAALRHHLRMVLSELPRIRAEHPELFDDDPGAPTS